MTAIPATLPMWSWIMINLFTYKKSTRVSTIPEIVSKGVREDNDVSDDKRVKPSVNRLKCKSITVRLVLNRNVLATDEVYKASYTISKILPVMVDVLLPWERSLISGFEWLPTTRTSSQHDPTLINLASVGIIDTVRLRCEVNVREGANLTFRKPNTNQQSGKCCRLI